MLNWIMWLWIWQILGLEQHVPEPVSFSSPVKHTIILAGSFGELRSGHFHTGLDIKPKFQGAIGDTIFSCADGYVSRIKIQRGGYGKAIYVDHPNGYTTVYAHLSKLTPDLEAYVLSIQQSVESYEIDVQPEANKLPVVAKKPIGLMGNSGRSFGPHLHFEIRETQTETPVNPLSFGIKPSDTYAPVIQSISLHGLDANSQIVYYDHLQCKPNAENTYGTIETAIPAWRAGIAIECYDKMNGAGNKNGIYQIQILVDDSLYYNYVNDNIKWQDNEMVDAYTDAYCAANFHRTEALCYQLPGNTIANIKAAENAGKFALFESKFREVKILVSDFEGNKSTQTLRIKRNIDCKTFTPPPYRVKLKPNENTHWQNDSISITIDEKSVAKEVYFNATATSTANNIIYNVGQAQDALLKPMLVNALIPTNMPGYADKVRLVRKKNGKKGISYGGNAIQNRFEGKIYEFGEYTFVVDTIAPKILANKFFTSTNVTTDFIFIIDDNIETKKEAKDFDYDVWIDDQWLACEYKEMTDKLYISLDHLLPGSHHLKIRCVDNANNEKIYENDFSIE